jgi:hypothetical protein
MALLPLMYPITCDTPYLGDRNYHMHMIWHKMILFNPAFLLQRQPAKYLAEVLPQLRIERFSPTPGNEYDVIFALPLRMAQAFMLAHRWNFPFVCPAAHDSEFRRWAL